MGIPQLSWPSQRQPPNGLNQPLIPILRGIVGLIVGLALAGCSSLSSPAPSASPEGVPKQLLHRQVIVTLAPEFVNQWDRITAELTQAYGLPKVGAFPLPSIGVQCLVLQIPETRAFPTMLDQLKADPRVETVQANQFFQSQARTYNDPYGKFQHGTHTIHAALAHSTATGKGVKIAVIDTGVDAEHPDLRGRITGTANFVAGGQSKFTNDRHGTAVAGVIAAQANNAIGIFGVAPEADLLALKACWHRSPTSAQALCSSWTLARAVDFAIQQDARILNLSLAGPPDPLLERLLATAAARGATAVAATLNPAQGLGFPASLETVIAVIPSDTQGQVSNPHKHTGSTLLAAPGIDIVTTLPKETYDFLSGSSLAAAHVSGIAALLLERDPTLTPAHVQDILRTTAHPVHSPKSPGQFKIGLVDACAALNQLVSIPSCPK